MPKFQGLGARINADVGGFTGPLGNALSVLGRFKGALIGVGTIVGGGAFLREAIDEAVRFESAIADIQKVTDAFTAQQMRSSIRGMSEEIPLARRELSSIVEAAGRMGIQGTQNIEQFTETVGKLSVATNLSADQAGRQFGRLGALMNVPVEQMERLGSIVNEESNNIRGSTSEIVDAMLRSAAAANTFGLSAQDITAVNAAIVEVSASARRGGTRIRRLFQELTDPGRVEVFSQALGMTAQAFKDMRQNDPRQLLLELIRTVRQGGRAAEFLRGELDSVSRQALEALASNLGNLETSLQRTNREWGEAKSLSREFAVQAETTASRTQILDNRVSNLQEEIGRRMLPTYSGFLSHLNESVGVINRVVLGIDRLNQKMGETVGQGFADQFRDQLSLESQFGIGEFEEMLKLFPGQSQLVEALFPSNLIEAAIGNDFRKRVGNAFVNTMEKIPQDIRQEVAKRSREDMGRLFSHAVEQGLTSEQTISRMSQILAFTVDEVQSRAEGEVEKGGGGLPNLPGISGARPASELGANLSDEQLRLIRELRGEFDFLRGKTENQIALQHDLTDISSEELDTARDKLEKFQQMNKEARERADAMRIIEQSQKRINRIINKQQQKQIAPQIGEEARQAARNRLEAAQRRRRTPGIIRPTPQMSDSEFRALRNFVQRLDVQKIRREFQDPQAATERLETFRARKRREEQGIIGVRPKLGQAQVRELKRLAGEATATQRVMKMIQQSLGPSAKTKFQSIVRGTRKMDQSINNMKNELKSVIRELARKQEINVTTQIDGRELMDYVVKEFESRTADVAVSASP